MKPNRDSRNSNLVPGPKLKVLIVDDEQTTLEVIGALLEDAGFAVSTRSNAVGTAATIIREKPDVVLLDVQMPGLRGDRIVQLAAGRSMVRRPSFILYSSTEHESLEKLARSVGAIGCIMKTGNYAEFVRQFRLLAERHRARRPRDAV